VAAELDGYVAAIDDRDNDQPQATTPVDANIAQRETADDPSRHPDADADPKPEPKNDAAAVLGARRQYDQYLMVTGFGVRSCLGADRQDCASPRAEEQTFR
jgi:hypothetical protein